MYTTEYPSIPIEFNRQLLRQRVARERKREREKVRQIDEQIYRKRDRERDKTNLKDQKCNFIPERKNNTFNSQMKKQCSWTAILVN